jgi:hypothetical protein
MPPDLTLRLPLFRKREYTIHTLLGENLLQGGYTQLFDTLLALAKIQLIIIQFIGRLLDP